MTQLSGSSRSVKCSRHGTLNVLSQFTSEYSMKTTTVVAFRLTQQDKEALEQHAIRLSYVAKKRITINIILRDLTEKYLKEMRKNADKA